MLLVRIDGRSSSGACRSSFRGAERGLAEVPGVTIQRPDAACGIDFNRFAGDFFEFAEGSRWWRSDPARPKAHIYLLSA